MTRKPAIADNSLVDGLLESNGVGTLETEHIGMHFWDDDEIPTGVGVIRVHAGRERGGITLSTDFESAEAGFSVGANVSLNHDQCKELVRYVAITAGVDLKELIQESDGL